VTTSDSGERDSGPGSFAQTHHTPTGALKTRLDEEDEWYCPACSQSYATDTKSCPNDGARLVKLKATRDPLIGRVFENRYEIRTTLGEGGMGTVYRGWQLSVDREVAIKVVHSSIASDRTAVKRFLREARLSSRLSQPNIVNVYDFGQTEDGILYLVMELLRGNTLAHELEAQRALPLRRVLTIAMQLCDALQAAHAMGIVHRDLKPGNVVILADPPGRDLLKVLDFGLAKSLVAESTSNVTNTNAILGTPLYMAPEQIEGKATDQRADIYAMGCMLHQMLTGRPPFLAENANLVLAAHMNDPIPPLPATVPQTLVAVIERMMAKRVEARIRDIQTVHTALQSVIDGGYGASDLADTTPDIPPEVAQHLRKSSPIASPIALANTQDIDAAVAIPAVSTPSLPGVAPPLQARSSRLVPLLAAIAVISVAAVIILLVMTKGGGAQQPVGVPPVTPDAAVVAPSASDAAALPAITVDAARPPDDAAIVAPPRDAKVARTRPDGGARPPKPDAAVPAPAPIDAAVKKAATPDAMPNIDFVRIKKDAGS